MKIKFEMMVWSLIGILLGWAIYSLTVGSFDWSGLIASFAGISVGVWKLRKQETVYFDERVISIAKNIFLWTFVGSYLILFAGLVVFKYFLHLSSVPVDLLIVYVVSVFFIVFFFLPSFLKTKR